MSGTGKHEKLIEFPIDHTINLSFIATEFPGACALEYKYPTELRTLKLTLHTCQLNLKAGKTK